MRTRCAIVFLFLCSAALHAGDVLPREEIDRIVKPALQREPGEKCVYSNLGVALLGHVLALRARQSYEDLLLEGVCRPLNLQSTRITFDDSMRRRLAAPYDVDGNRVKNWDLPTFAGAGGIRSTAGDMLRYAAAEAGITRTQLAPAMELTQKRRREFAKAYDIGMGWMISKKDGHYWHNGQTGGYHTAIAFDVQERVAVVVLATTNSGVVDVVTDRLLRRMRGETVEPPKVLQTVPIDPSLLDRYAGEFKIGPLTWITIKRAGDHLTLRVTGQSACRIYPESETQFFLKAADAQVTFELAEGKVDALVLHQNGHDVKGVRTK